MSAAWDAVAKIFRGNPLSGDEGNAAQFLGTAFLISETALLTCKHVVEQSPSWDQLHLLGGSVGGGGVVKILREPIFHPNQDVALLQLNPEAGGSTLLRLATTTGQLPIGSELTLAGFQSGYQSVNTSNTKIASYDGVYHLIQTDTTINKGISGGPAIRDGKVIGLVRAKNAAQALIVPVSLIRAWLQELGIGRQPEPDEGEPNDDRANVESIQCRSRRFAIAVSFPREDEKFVLEVVEYLAEQLGRERVFYAPWYEHELAGSDLDLKLRSIYRDQSDMIVPFFSNRYEKSWCGLEWSAIRALMLETRREDRIKPIKLDDTVIPGWERTDLAIEPKGRSATDIAKLLIQIWAILPERTRNLASTTALGKVTNDGAADVPDDNAKRFRDARERLRQKVEEELGSDALREFVLKANDLPADMSAQALANRIFACKPREKTDKRIETPLGFVDRCRKKFDSQKTPAGIEDCELLEKLWYLATRIAPISFVADGSQDLRRMVVGAANQAEVLANWKEVGVSQLAQFLGLVPNFNHQYAFDGKVECPLQGASDELEDHLHFGDGPNVLSIEAKDITKEVAKAIWTQVGAASDAIISVDAALLQLASSESYVCLCLTQRLSESAAKKVKEAFPTLYLIIPQSDTENRINEVVFLQLRLLKTKLDQSLQ